MSFRPSPRLVISFSIGGTSSNNAVRQIGWPELITPDALDGGGNPGTGEGVATFLARRVTPIFDLGAEYLAIWNPWGQEVRNNAAWMRASQLLIAQAIPEMAPAIDGWADAWAPVVARTKEAIVYCGGLHEDPAFSNLSAVNYMTKMRLAFGPFWSLPVSQGFDGDVAAPNTARAAAAIRLIHSTSRRCYVEALWGSTQTWSWDLPCIIRNDTYHAFLGQSFIRPKTTDWPEVLRICTPREDTTDHFLEDARAQIAEIFADGHSAILNGYPLVGNSIPLSSLYPSS